MQTGVYLFQHKFDIKKKYIGKSMALYSDLTRLFSGLYDKPDEKMTALERELRYGTPDAKDWNVRVWGTPPDKTYLEQAKLIIQHRTLVPSGLNEEVSFVSRKDFNAFCEWYTEFRRKKRAQ